MGAKIDWNEIITGYNKMFGTNYKKLETFLLEEGNKLSIEGLAHRVGCERCTINRLKKDLRITSQYIHGISKAQRLREFAKENDTSQFTAKELAEKFEFESFGSIYQILRREKIAHKRGYHFKEDKKNE